MTETSPKDLLALAAEVLEIESRAVDQLKSRLDDSFTAACQVCLDTVGRVVVTGMGNGIETRLAAFMPSGCNRFTTR